MPVTGYLTPPCSIALGMAMFASVLSVPETEASLVALSIVNLMPFLSISIALTCKVIRTKMRTKVCCNKE